MSDRITPNPQAKHHSHPFHQSPSNSQNIQDVGSSSSHPNPTHASHHNNYTDGNPLAHSSSSPSARNAAFAGYLEPGLYTPKKTKLGNPAPLGLSAFALTTFVLSLINLQTRGVTTQNLVVAVAFGYGGLVQLLAGMWEIAAGNTFGATALASYGGFWISFAILLTPGGFQIAEAYAGQGNKLELAIGFYLMGWFIFTFLLWLLTLRSTVVFSALFFFLWLAFLMLGIAHLVTPNPTSPTAAAVPNVPLTKAGGLFGLLAAFLAWYVAFAGIADASNSFFTVPVWHFPWSERGREMRRGEEGKDV
ncbi:hypothetical protein HYFRA_00010543 [Hymenoscyphus fraxineus]|uniref:Uncharacterized protein n=1 Tax=Hymenoscyphus fraxineus TaxID=746836 RepID=A0A9N9PY63_9HELO|nr:hypothetical protein HYFRA_00010543 [Hymenoscyphus fraxineus]